MKIKSDIRPCFTYNYTFMTLSVMVYTAGAVLMRILFLIWNRQYISEDSDILSAFLIGARFDLTAWFYLTGILYILWSLPIGLFCIRNKEKLYIRILALCAGIIFFFNGIDIGYYPFSEKRISYELFILKGDLQSFSPDVLLAFFPILAGFIFIITAVVYSLRTIPYFSGVVEKFITEKAAESKRNPLTLLHRSYLMQIAVFPLILILLAGILRGFGERPLRPAMAFSGADRFSGHLASNTFYNILFTSLEKKPEPVSLIDQAAAQTFIRNTVKNSFDSDIIHPGHPFHRKAEFRNPALRKNVVLIVMESFNGKDTGILNNIPARESITPGFDSLAGKGILFTRYYSNARRSIEAFPALLDSMPDILNFPIISTNLETNHYTNLAAVFKKQGYRTSFFHGGRNGTMGLDKYSKLAGFDQYFGKDEYEKENRTDDFDGHWGIYDHKFFDYFYNKLRLQAEANRGQPFFSVIFSLSNHHPFTLPPDYNPDNDQGLSPAQKTLKYSDSALYNFIKNAEKNPAFSNTVFIITADHNTFEGLNLNRNIMDIFRVPLLIYAPGFVKPETIGTPGSHTDLMPTLLELLSVSGDYTSTGKSLFQSEGDKAVILQDNGIYAFILNDAVLISSFAGMEKYLLRKNGNWEAAEKDAVPQDKREKLQIGFRSFYQEIHNGLIQNRMTAVSAKK